MKLKFFINLLTTVGVFLGLLAIYLAFMSHFYLSVPFILLSGIIDYFDGKISRKTNNTTKLGSYLDLTNDAVSFLIAPMVLFGLYFYVSYWVVLLSILWLASGIYRLYRFNHQVNKEIIVGLPTTIAGVSLTCFIALYIWLDMAFSYQWFLPIIAILSLGMISHWTFKKP